MRRMELIERLIRLEQVQDQILRVLGIQPNDQYSAISLDDMADTGEDVSDTRLRLTRELSDLNNRLMGAGEPLSSEDRDRLALLQRIEWPALEEDNGSTL